MIRLKCWPFSNVAIKTIFHWRVLCREWSPQIMRLWPYLNLNWIVSVALNAQFEQWPITLAHSVWHAIASFVTCIYLQSNVAHVPFMCVCGSVCAVARVWWLWWYLQSLFASVLNRSKNTRITSSVLIVHTPAGNTDLSWNWNSAAFKRRRAPDIEQIQMARECFDNSQRMLRATADGNLNSSHTNTHTHTHTPHVSDAMETRLNVQVYMVCIWKAEKMDKNRNWEKFRSIGLVYGKAAVGIQWNNKMAQVASVQSTKLRISLRMHAFILLRCMWVRENTDCIFNCIA